ncbi:MAG: hypothetical protein KJN89_09450 [Gammaproteobacteria bacterium]|nr:hypothetical protein [Gammaproteobacteria bacterium]MBT8133583.1 hypothetical protein [Gammaproteobacteria bacterium]NNJ50589.1 hypothetical protein [Gammaproteobacteria bacterium]
MTENQDQKYAHYRKMAWIIYALTSIVLMAVLVLFVAQDNEERFFFGLMTPAAFYVFRPTEKYMSKLILKYTGVSKPAEQE